MKRTSFILLLGSLFFNLISAAQDDSTFVMYQRDSAILPATDPTVLFFQENEKITPAQSAKISIVTKAGKTVKLPAFLKSIEGSYPPDHVLADLDNDGRKELLVYNFTGGAHCCDEIYIFRNIAANKYQHAARLFGGHTVIGKDLTFEYSFIENYGYFFTCYACGYADTSDSAPIAVTSVRLKYNKGKLNIIPGDTELKSMINDNLGKLCEKPYEPIDPELMQDDGQRKEVAINLAVYYYSFGKNLPETRKLFNKYYKYPDAGKVWAAFARQLQSDRTTNGF